MGTLNAIYIRAADSTSATAVQAPYPSAYSVAGAPFLAAEQPENHFRCPDAELQRLSAQLKTDVIWLSFQSVVDAFQYHHWKSGRGS